MKYVPNTDADRRRMLDAIGVASVEELFSDIPKEVRLKRELDLPKALSEPELIAHMESLAKANSTTEEYACFLGAGAYDHFVPSAVHHITGRSEFYTAYTPYQAEISQGVLQSIYEYQSLICELTGMDLATASHYDGATATAESAIVAKNATRRPEVLMLTSVNPEYRRVTATYTKNAGLTVTEVPYDQKTGQCDIERLKSLISDKTAAVIAQSPNFFGIIEDMEAISEIAHRAGALFTAVVDPISLGILKPPGEYGADMAVGEGQALGNTLSYGGPYLGFFTATRDQMRRVPGRIAGATVDKDGNRGFVLTLQAREQHIRRERALSNICSNQALNALAAAVYLSLAGKTGIQEAAKLCLSKAHYAAAEIAKIPGYSLRFSGPFFKEFAVTMPHEPLGVARALLGQKILGPYPLGQAYRGHEKDALFAVTEKRTREEIDRLVRSLEVIK